VATIQESLEASLQERWDRATVEVYGDHLLDQGDPRGELIALDRQIRSSGLTGDFAAQKRELLRTWLGAGRGDAWDPAWFRDGFVELHLDEEGPRAQELLRDLLASPAGPYLRILRISAPSPAAGRALEVLCRGQHPWLQRLELRPRDHAAVMVSSPDAFTRATPRLHTLCLPAGSVGFFAPDHPLRRLELGRPYPPRLSPDVELPRVIELGLQLTAGDDLDSLQHLLRPERFPALRRLDLSNDAWADRSPIGAACELAVWVHRTGRLTHLCLPPLRTRDDAPRVQRLLDSLPDLAELSFGRRYLGSDALHAELDHPAIAPLPPARPWPIDDARLRRASFWISFDNHFCQQLEILWSVCLGILEPRFDDLPEPLRKAWSRLGPALTVLAASANRGRAIRCSTKLFAQAMQALLDERQQGPIWTVMHGIERSLFPVEIRWNGPADELPREDVLALPEIPDGIYPIGFDWVRTYPG
jgi:hypothetical protein